MFWFRVTSFIKFLWYSTNQYGIHSPFIYQFLIKCLYKGIPKSQLNALKHNREFILSSKTVPEIKAPGQESVQLKSKTRQVCDVAETNGMSLHKSKLINKMISYFNVTSTLELGTSAGLGSIAMATQQPQNSIDSVEAGLQAFKVTQKNLELLQLKTITLYNSSFQDFLQELPDQKTYDLIYLNCQHDEQLTWECFLQLKTHMHSDSIIILDEIYCSKGMQNIWATICKDESVKVSLDLYFWGILFFKPGLSKQDFKIRCFI